MQIKWCFKMNKKISISEILFYIPYIIWLILCILQQTYYRNELNLNLFFNIVNIILYIFLFFKILIEDKYSFKSLIAFLVMCLLFFVKINSKVPFLIDTFLLIYSARNINVREIIKVTFFIEIFMIIFIILSSYLGIIKNDIWYRDNLSIRYGLGYVYTTFLANYYFHIVLMYLYLKNNYKFKITEGIIIIFLNYIIYKYTDTKAVYYLINLIVVFALVLNLKKKSIKEYKIFSFFIKYCFPISALISIFASINFNQYNQIYYFFNNILTDRLILGHTAFNNYGIKLFGQQIVWTVGRSGIDRPSDSVYNFVDCAYLNIALAYGIIILIFLCLGFVLIGKIAIKNNDKYLCLVLIFLAIHSITDPQLIELRYNPFLFMFGVFFFKNYNFGKNNFLPSYRNYN